MKMLLVEDDPDQIQTYKDNITSFNKKEKIQIAYDIVDTIPDAKSMLDSESYDVAIIDLKLDKSVDEYQGEKIIELIVDSLRIPVFVYSSSVSHIQREETLFFKKRLRTTSFSKILEESLLIYKTGITNILGKKGQIEDYLNKIFWSHLSCTVENWINDDTRSSEQKEKSLLRYTLLHIQEHLEQTIDSDFENYHPAEVYISPVIKGNPFTGDIITRKDTTERFIILTPSCDMAQKKAKDVLIAEIENSSKNIISQKLNSIKRKLRQISQHKTNIKSAVGKEVSPIIEEDLKNLNEDIEILSNKIILAIPNTTDAKIVETVTKELNSIKQKLASDEAESELKLLITNNFSNKYHYLPKTKYLEDGLINFQKLQSIGIKDLTENFERKASVNSSFTKDIIARFSAYYARQGSPDLNFDEVYHALF